MAPDREAGVPVSRDCSSIARRCWIISHCDPSSGSSCVLAAVSRSSSAFMYESISLLRSASRSNFSPVCLGPAHANRHTSTSSFATNMWSHCSFDLLKRDVMLDVEFTVSWCCVETKSSWPASSHLSHVSELRSHHWWHTHTFRLGQCSRVISLAKSHLSHFTLVDNSHYLNKTKQQSHIVGTPTSLLTHTFPIITLLE